MRHKWLENWYINNVLNIGLSLYKEVELDDLLNSVDNAITSALNNNPVLDDVGKQIMDVSYIGDGKIMLSSSDGLYETDNIFYNLQSKNDNSIKRIKINKYTGLDINNNTHISELLNILKDDYNCDKLIKAINTYDMSIALRDNYLKCIIDELYLLSSKKLLKTPIKSFLKMLKQNYHDLYINNDYTKVLKKSPIN